MMQKLQEEYPERRDLLIKLLGVDLRKFYDHKVAIMMLITVSVIMVTIVIMLK